MGTIELNGIYDRTFRRNEANGYTFFTMKPSQMVTCMNQYGTVSCIGKIQPFVQGIPIRLKGEVIQSNSTFFVKVKTIQEDYSHKDVMIAYLQSGYFKGIGEKTAAKIYETFGAHLEEIIHKKNAKEIIMDAKIRNLSEDKIEILIETMKKTTAIREVYEFMSKLGVNQSFSAKLMQKYGVDGLEKLKNDPYKTGPKIRLPFQYCDYLGYRKDTIPFEKKRIQSMVLDILHRNENNGNTKISYYFLKQCIQKMSKQSVYHCRIPDSCIYFAVKEMKKNIVVEDEFVYLRKTWIDEANIVKQLKRLEKSRKKLFYEIPCKKNRSMKPSESQSQSFHAILESGIKMIIGGPGTGKTTTIQELIYFYQCKYPEFKIELCAPTGRAAQRITETTGRNAQTIHKLLEYKVIMGEEICKNENDPINADVIIIDEFGMVDTKLFSLFLSAVKSGTTIILCGDENQLPSVGAGNILFDLKHSKLFETYVLDTVFRQENSSSVFQNIVKIQNGDPNFIIDENFKIFNLNTDEEFQKAVKKMMQEFETKESQVLTMTRVNERGSIRINKNFQENIKYQTNETLEYGKHIFHTGDHIILNSNNYDLGYFNGDIGEIIKIESKEMKIKLYGKNDVITLNLENMDDVEPSYAITIYKAQGSEYPSGSIVIPAYPEVMLNRNMLFTAVSRFRNSLTIYSQNNSWLTALRNQRNMKRLTGLQEKLQKHKEDFYGYYI